MCKCVSFGMRAVRVGALVCVSVWHVYSVFVCTFSECVFVSLCKWFLHAYALCMRERERKSERESVCELCVQVVCVCVRACTRVT